MNDITEENRHAIYDHYFPNGKKEQYQEIKRDYQLFAISVFFFCIDELYAFHKAKSYTINEPSENWLLAEWMLYNDRVPANILESALKKYHEDMKRSLSHFIYDIVTSWEPVDLEKACVNL